MAIEQVKPALYVPSGPTIEDFHNDSSPVRLIIGPVGSGRSTGCLVEGINRSLAQKPYLDGVRRTRGVIVRQTFADLKRTTITTWERIIRNFFGSKLGFPKRRDEGYTHNLHFINEADGTIVDAEIWFVSLDGPDAIGKLMSLELTWAYFNECYLIQWPIVREMGLRVGRYPSKDQGYHTWSGWWADTNAPDDLNWVYKKAEKEKLPNWAFFKQPPAAFKIDGEWQVNPKAENIENQPKGIAYYQDIIDEKPADDWIRVRLGNEYGFVREGKVIISDYTDNLHTAKAPLDYDLSIPIVYVGIDFGATPAAGFLQQAPTGQWRCIDELNAEKVGVRAFSQDQLIPHINTIRARYRGRIEFVITGDPTGSGTSQTDASTPFKILEDEGIECEPAYTNDFGIRTEVLNKLCRVVVDGQPRFQISPACAIARQGLSQRYVMKRVGIKSDEGQVYKTVPDKNEFSHIVEAIEYGIMGSGEGQEIGRGGARGKERERRKSKDHRKQKAAAIV